jgi:nucleotide-binding universal stress UspA family protein
VCRFCSVEAAGSVLPSGLVRSPVVILSRVMRIKRILVPTDLSAASLRALELAEELGKAFKAELVLLFVVETLYTSGDILSAGAVASVLDAQRKTASGHLGREVARLRRRGLRARSSVGEGAAAAAIVESARRGFVDLIVIGTHGRTGFSHLLMGSVAERVVRTAGCPVLTVGPPPKKTTRKAGSRQRNPRGSTGVLRRPSTTTLI